MLAVALGLGALIGLSLGALGGGGSILTVPALVYALGESPRDATAGSLVIVGLTAIAGTLGHARAGRVRWRAGTAFGLAGVAASFAGTWANRAVDQNVLLLGFAALMLLAAGGMLRRARPQTAGRGGADSPVTSARHTSATKSSGPRRSPQRSAATAAASDTDVLKGTAPAARPSTHSRRPHWTRTVANVIAPGLAVGFLTGLFGVGGGFVIVPALIFALHYDMADAVGTSLLIIAINSGAALLARASHQTFHWAVITPFTLAAITGTLAGKRVADRVSGPALTRAFAVLLLAVAGYVATRSITAMT